MLELFLTATIIWTTQTGIIKHCYPNLSGADDAAACYDHDSNIIYINKKTSKAIPKDLVLYHEIGHSLYWMDFPKDVFKESVFDEPDYEVMADDFAWWAYGKKHPKQQKFVNEILTPQKIKFFEDSCKVKCINSILTLKRK